MRKQVTIGVFLVFVTGCATPRTQFHEYNQQYNTTLKEIREKAISGEIHIRGKNLEEFERNSLDLESKLEEIKPYVMKKKQEKIPEDIVIEVEYLLKKLKLFLFLEKKTKVTIKK